LKGLPKNESNSGPHKLGSSFSTMDQQQISVFGDPLTSICEYIERRFE